MFTQREKADQAVAVGDHMLLLDIANVDQTFADNKLGEVFEFKFELLRVLFGDPNAALVSRKVFTASSTRPQESASARPGAAAAKPFISSHFFFSATSPSQVSAATR